MKFGSATDECDIDGDDCVIGEVDCGIDEEGCATKEHDCMELQSSSLRVPAGVAKSFASLFRERQETLVYSIPAKQTSKMLAALS